MSSKVVKLESNKKLIYILLSIVALATIVLYSMKTGSIEISFSELIKGLITNDNSGNIGIIKDVRNVLEATKVVTEEETKEVKKNLNKKEKSALIKKYTAEMMESAKNLQFERAAQLRDMIEELKK